MVNVESDKMPSLKISLLDYKGSITLAVTIISFLLAITYLGMQNSSRISTTFTTSSLGIISVASLILFIFFEKRAAFPLINLKLMVHKIILPANIILMIFGMTMFMVYQSIPVLVRTPEPIGFSGDAITAANIQTSLYDNIFNIRAIFWLYNIKIWHYKTHYPRKFN